MLLKITVSIFSCLFEGVFIYPKVMEIFTYTFFQFFVLPYLFRTTVHLKVGGHMSKNREESMGYVGDSEYTSLVGIRVFGESCGK